MNLSSFRYFHVLARERNFTRAAQQLHISQQTLSSHIASLEEELGCKLVVRRVPLELTYAGTVFLRYSKQILDNMKNLHREFCDITANQKGVLRIGIASTRGRAVMPLLITRFQKQYPNIEIQLSEDVNQALHHNLLNGEVDIAIAHFKSTTAEIELSDFYCEEIVLLISEQLLQQLHEKGNEFSLNHGDIDLSQFRHCPFLMGNADDIAGNIGWMLIAQAAFRPVVKARSDNIETILSLCVQGAGACFCPANLAEAVLSPAERSTLKMFHLGNQAKYSIQFGVLKANYQWKIISEFIRIAKEMPMQT